MTGTEFGLDLVTLEELSSGVFELKPTGKLDSWLPPFCGFKDMDAERDKAFPNEDTDSITF
jgi:hypothetical protein